MKTTGNKMLITAEKMCGLRSKIKNEWLDGIFPRESLKQQAKNRIPSKNRNGWLDGIFPQESLKEHAKIRITKKNKREGHQVFIIDPNDTKLLEKRKEILHRNIKFLLEDFIRFYIRRCIYTPILYMAVVTALSHYISGVLCLVLSLIFCIVTVVFHYLYRIIYLGEDDDEDEEYN